MLKINNSTKNQMGNMRVHMPKENSMHNVVPKQQQWKVQGGWKEFNHLNNSSIAMFSTIDIIFYWKSSWMFECSLNPFALKKRKKLFYFFYFSLSSLSLKGKPVRDLGILWTIEIPWSNKNLFPQLKA